MTLRRKNVDNRCAKCQIGGGSIKQNVVTNDEADQPCPDKKPQIDNSKSKVRNLMRKCKRTLSIV